MDLSEHIAPTSDQMDAVDLIGGPQTFTVERVTAGNSEQPVNYHFAEFPRPWRPSKSMRRVILAAWGKDTSTHTGRRITLYCDPNVMFGKDKVGGTRIKAMSDLPGGKTFSTPLLITRGKSATYTVEPLTEPAPRPAPTADDVVRCTDVDTLRAMYRAADENVRALIMTRVAELEEASPC